MLLVLTKLSITYMEIVFLCESEFCSYVYQRITTHHDTLRYKKPCSSSSHFSQRPPPITPLPHRELGTTSLAVLYGALVVSCLLLPALLISIHFSPSQGTRNHLPRRLVRCSSRVLPPSTSTPHKHPFLSLTGN